MLIESVRVVLYRDPCFSNDVELMDKICESHYGYGNNSKAMRVNTLRVHDDDEHDGVAGSFSWSLLPECAHKLSFSCNTE